MAELTITHHTVLDAELTNRCHAMYLEAFTPVRTEAAARHLLTSDEFAHEMADTRIDKYVASRAGTPVGLATFTNDLSAVAWIERQFYLSRWPDRAARGALFYLGFALAAPSAAGGGVFTRLIDTALHRCADLGGTICWDAARCNVEGAVGRINERVKNHWGADVDVVDTQTYYVAHFDEPGTRAGGQTPS